ncbi:MAG: metallophosphoesterase family protein [Chloroflexi bacterium]|nr:metallophosphoesterase family protein [Chloroflexota bacterium]
MRVAVFSDIHGNAFALDVMLADLKKSPADVLVCLGDAIQGGPQPRETVQRLRELDCPVVMGNADEWLLTGKEDISGPEQISPERLQKMKAVREWSLSKLSDAECAFIASFQPMLTIPLSDTKKLSCYHGTPASNEEILLPDTPYENFRNALGGKADTLYCGGHTHVQFTRRVGATFHFNPGSVGLAYSHHQPDDAFHADAVAEYALLTVDGARTALEFRRVPYDAAEVMEIYRTSGRPYADEALAQYA